MGELEFRYVFKINQVKEHIKDPKFLDFIWIKRYRKDLRKRLDKLEHDYSKDLISDKAYHIWKKMIKEVL